MLMIDVPFEPLPVLDSSCVLVVEDEFLIRTMVSDALRDAGFAVIEATPMKPCASFSLESR